MRAEVTEWLLRTFAELAPDVEIQLVVTPLPLEFARNEQVRRFLASDCTHLFILDADCVPQLGTVQRLLRHDLPFVTAPHPTMIGVEVGLMVMDAAEGGGYRSHQPTTGMQRVDVVGCAGMLIRRDVLTSIPAPWFTFDMDENGNMLRGEDFGLCEKMAALNIEVWADCDLVQKHWVSVPL